ncbi:MAG: hypothetical protein ACK58L_20880, partial [Planctomycetota bacterium]
QLGYYYAKVPTWQSRPDLVPPAPVPSNFHHRICPGGSGHGCLGGHGHVGHGSQCQNCHGGYAYNAPMMPQPRFVAAPVGQQVVRQSAPEKKGLLGGFRLTSMSELFE